MRLLLVAVVGFSSLLGGPAKAASLTLGQRVLAQRAIEEVYGHHRAGGGALPDAVLQEKVTRYLARGGEVTGAQLQAEMERMARDTHAPGVLRELFDALGNDPRLIAETLARPVLVERLSGGEPFLDEPSYPYTTVEVGAACVPDSWRTIADAPARAGHSAVWTGAEMIVWGGTVDVGETWELTQSGAAYDPATDSWRPTAVDLHTPSARSGHTAVWTGSEMIVWGGASDGSGGRYDPASDSWAPTSGVGAPEARSGHTAVWTGTGMIVWGGETANGATATGALYDPVADAWTPTSLGPGVPTARSGHRAVWTGAEMVVWGGTVDDRSGGRYRLSTDSWQPTAIPDFPLQVYQHTAVWTGTEMIVYGGGGPAAAGRGGRYDPVADLWVQVAPQLYRAEHTAVWTGTEMILWGGVVPSSQHGRGSRYDPASGAWTDTARNVAMEGMRHTAVWTGSEMLVWGGFVLNGFGPMRAAYCSGTSPLHPVPDGILGPPMRASRQDAAGTLLTITWDVTICASPLYEILYGSIASFPFLNPVGAVCNLDASGTAPWSSVPAGSLWFVVVGMDGAGREGSWGQGSNGERGGVFPSDLCGNQGKNTAATCP